MAAIKGMNFKLSATASGLSALSSFTRAVSGIAVAGRDAQSAVGNWSSMMNRLRGEFNPTAAAAEALQEKIKRLTLAQQLGVISVESYEQQLSNLQRDLRQVGQASDLASSSFRRGVTAVDAHRSVMTSWNRGLSDNRRAFQNIGFQVSDFAVQIAGGQSVMLAFVQQGGQVLQFFGVWGAVLAGFLTVFGTIAIVMIKTGGALEHISTVGGVLTGVFGALLSGVKTVGAALVPVINFILTNMDFLLIAGGLVATFMATRWVAAWFMGTTAVRAFLFSLALVGPLEAMTIVATSLFTAAISALSIALNLLPLVALIAGAAILIKWFLQLARGAGGFGAALALLGDVAVEVWDRMASGQALISAAAEEVSAGIQIAFASAFNWLMHNANIAAHAVASALVTIDDFLNGPNKGPATIPGVADIDALTNIDTSGFVALQDSARATRVAVWEGVVAPLQSVQALMAAFNKGAADPVDIASWFSGSTDGAGGAGGGATSEIAKLAKEYADLVKTIDPAVIATRAFAEANKMMMDAFKTGNLEAIQAAFDKVKPIIEDLQKQFEDLTKTISQSMMSAFSAVVKRTESLADGIKSVLNSIIDKTIEMLMSPIFDGIAGFLGKSIFGAIGGLGLVPTFAGGGDTGGGSRSGGLDGQGGFLAMMHPKESVTDHTRGGRDGGGGVTIVVNVSGATGNNEVREMVSRGVEAGLRVYDRKVLPSSVKRVINNPRRNA